MLLRTLCKISIIMTTYKIIDVGMRSISVIVLQYFNILLPDNEIQLYVPGD